MENTVLDNVEESNDSSSVPFILRGKFFKVVSKIEGKVEAKCVSCKKIVKGSLDSTGNFHRHLKVIIN